MGSRVCFCLQSLCAGSKEWFSKKTCCLSLRQPSPALSWTHLSEQFKAGRRHQDRTFCGRPMVAKHCSLQVLANCNKHFDVGRGCSMLSRRRAKTNLNLAAGFGFTTSKGIKAKPPKDLQGAQRL